MSDNKKLQINPNALFRDQLRKVSSAINKKHTVLRKQIIKTLEVFENENLPVFPYEVCFGLFKHIIETASLSGSLIFFPFLQSIINLGYANEEMSREILTLLTHIKSIPKFNTPENSSKLQTLIMLLVSRNAVNLNNLNYTHSVVNILFSLDNLRSKNLWLKTLSILNQIVLLYINELKDSEHPLGQTQRNQKWANSQKQEEEKIPKQEPKENTASKADLPEQKNGHRSNNVSFKKQQFKEFLHDVVLIARNQQPKWLIEIPEPYLAMALLSEILDQQYIKDHSEELQESFKGLEHYLRKSISKISHSVASSSRHSSSSSSSFKQKSEKTWDLSEENCLILCMRVACKHSKLYLENFQILEEVIKIVTEKTTANNGIKFIGYESLNFMFASAPWMNAMLESPSADLFNFLLTTLFNNAKLILSQHRDSIDLNVEYEIEKAGKIFYGNFVDFCSFGLDPVIELKMIIKNIEEISLTFYSIYQSHYKIQMEREIGQDEEIPLEKTYKFCQKTIFEISKSLIPKEMPEDILQSLLKICEKFINLSGVFKDNNTTTSYMKLLCRYCLPNDLKSIQYRHVQINKMILNIANCLGNLFSTGCWAIVWKALENYSIYYNRYLNDKEDLQAERKTDVEILYKSMDSIFTESTKYHNHYLLKILRSLIEVTYECLENNFSGTDSKKIFAFERIEQVYRINLFRIPIIWQELSSSLLCLTTSKVSSFRLSALGLLNTLVPLTLYHIKSHPQILETELEPESVPNGSKMTAANHESVIFEPWLNLSSCQFPEIKSELSIAVNKIIIDYGHIMESGWPSILEIIKKLKDIKSLQAIIETYLDKISPNIMETINIIDEVERSLSDMNQKYLCLTLIWAIGDHCHKNEQKDELRKIYSILLQPEEMFILGMEARHSSFYIFAEIIVHNCLQKSEKFWGWIFGEIRNYYTFALEKCRQRTESSEEQLKNILVNLIKIYRRLFSISKEFPADSGDSSGNKLVLELIGEFFSLCSKMLEFRESEVYQMVLKQSKQMVLMKTEDCLQVEQFWGYIQSLNQIYFVENETKILKCLVTYLPSDIYEILSRCLAESKRRLNIIYRLMEKVFLLRLEAEEKDIKLDKLRIFFEFKSFMEFFKKLQNEVLKLSSGTQKEISAQEKSLVQLYLENLIKTNHKLLLYEDYGSLEKMLPFMSSIVLNFPQSIDHRDCLELLKKIIYLKYDQQWIGKYSKSRDIPVWYIASQELIKQGYLYSNQRMEEPYQRVYQIFGEILSKQESQNQLKQIEKVYSAESLPLFFQGHLEALNFLAECYFFNPKFQDIKIEEIQSITRNIKNNAAFDETDKTNKKKNSYELLFKLSHKRDFENNQVLRSRQSVIFRVFLERVTQSFSAYLKGIAPNKGPLKDGQNAEEFDFFTAQSQIKFVLKKFLSFKVNEEILECHQVQEYLHGQKTLISNISVIKTQSGHLFILHSYISKCIRSENPQIRELVADIMEKVGTELGKKD